MTAAEVLVREEIEREGAISFARFMELALYAPGAGYYTRGERPVGRRGDFFTSVSVGPVFGFLLAARFALWCADFERVELIEAAAHDGHLAADVLGALERFQPQLWPRVRYRILEPFEARRAEQSERLAAWRDRVEWSSDWSEVPRPITGAVFANELLDAFPVRRFAWDKAAGRWNEACVEVHAATGALAGCARPAESPLDLELVGAVQEWLPDGFIVERSPAREAWWQVATGFVERGYLMAADYGYDAPHGIRPECPNGTLRAYHRHRVTHQVLDRPGEQDLTAHVDFGRLRALGIAAGMAVEMPKPQGRWLGAVAAEVFDRGGAAAAWLADHARQLQTLIHPAHLGQVMQVLVQSRV